MGEGGRFLKCAVLASVAWPGNLLATGRPTWEYGDRGQGTWGLRTWGHGYEHRAETQEPQRAIVGRQPSAAGL